MERITLFFKSVKSNSLFAILALALWSCDAGYGDWDDNNSGYIEEEEFEEGFAEAGYYDRWDEDGDNLLSENELYTGVFSTLDEDGNDLIDKNEWRTYSVFYSNTIDDNLGTFNDWDQNDDNAISFNEFDEKSGDLFAFDDWDTNNNDFLDEEEINQGVFDLWDQNDDQQVDQEEFARWETTFGNNESLMGGADRDDDQY